MPLAPLPGGSVPPRTADSAPLELDGGLAELRGDCLRMAPHWRTSGPGPEAAEPVPPSRIRGVRVPSSSARLVAGMSEYGEPAPRS
ncbi:hypothetical protein [Streptomyces zingiberis]|uniref:Uncharacterized protein n=1 Tax=Streptomyces zingiberis TaxID=2053010 RepID=A0ABX1BU65_9ACTN|nr:hypothetical protein [Streptomyces zingiberis]NJP99762.1 hypothetical protein [Streptomyces zingiberis]